MNVRICIISLVIGLLVYFGYRLALMGAWLGSSLCLASFAVISVIVILKKIGQAND